MLTCVQLQHKRRIFGNFWPPSPLVYKCTLLTDSPGTQFVNQKSKFLHIYVSSIFFTNTILFAHFLSYVSTHLFQNTSELSAFASNFGYERLEKYVRKQFDTSPFPFYNRTLLANPTSSPASLRLLWMAPFRKQN